MAKTVQPVAIDLKIKGGEKLGALNRSFRDLSKQVEHNCAGYTNVDLLACHMSTLRKPSSARPSLGLP